ncbi:hypothetical protein QMK19_25970 [Streptomyces sp. H10-C2]|uniref:hypothetical protein n=1 Tax=unclassified Streptomyces TaxID=2593676 RepID=UPI0024B8E976|nr:MULTISPECIES: hypothetical protein [unclassified Streptomyces]MDJ0345644.1 hypothetical protein [Streptomyces sp. PH10-H1]MDJ0373009.1 hypothetical protein [Streptomyces sp. H10-C2]
MATDDDRQAALRLAGQAHEVGRVSGRKPWREALQWISRGRLGRRHGWPVVPELATPWQDTISPERTGWRNRAANLDDEHAFAVDYRICRRCRLGWVENPYTMPQYERCGLATAGLAALCAEHLGLAWHTLGGHSTDAQAFWTAVGTDVPGGYQQRSLCPHVTS